LKMPDQPPPDRFKPEMPQIPGVSMPDSQASPVRSNGRLIIVSVVAVVIVLLVGARWLARPKHIDATPATPPPQIEVATPSPVPIPTMPHASESESSISTLTEMAKPWSTKEFYFKNRLTGENVPAVLIRLPIGSAAQASSYWHSQKMPLLVTANWSTSRT
jgi:hypothetical protein